MTNGQLLIGSTGLAPSLGNLTSTDGSVTVTNGAGTIDLSVSASDDAVLTLTGDAGGPVSPTLGDIDIQGVTVANAANIKPVYVQGSPGSSLMEIDVQVGAAITGAPVDKNDAGLVSFDDTAFGVNANGYVTLIGGGVATTNIDVDASTAPGTDPVVPSMGNIVMTGAQVATGVIGANVIRTNSLAANTVTIEIQRSTAVAAADSTKNGVAHFDTSAFSVDANGFVTLAGGAGPAVDTNIGDDGVSVTPNGSGAFTWLGTTVANATHAKPVYFKDSSTANALDLDVQVGAAITGAPADKNDAGLVSFDDTEFSVDANGFVQLAGTGPGQTITGDSGGAISPTGSNWNINGLSGSKTSGAASTLTIKSPPYADQGVGTVSLNSGSFVTGAVTITLPASVGLADGDLVEIVATNGIVTVQLVGTQVGHLGSAVTSAAGTFTGSSVGDFLALRYQASTDDFWCVSAIGVWILA